MQKFMTSAVTLMLSMVVLFATGCKPEDDPINGGGNNGGGNVSGNGSCNGHTFVDLGLPSGTLWATCNVGATIPEGYGNYFAWGETITKSTYNWSTYKWCKGDDYQLTKYCNDSYYGYNGFTDNLTTLQLSDDAARANWGYGWRIPTREEWDELLENTICDRFSTLNGVDGCLFTASNGVSLFLPAAGYRWDDELCLAGMDGHYFSSSLHTDYQGGVWLFHYPSCAIDGIGSRSGGCSVRAVLSASKN